MIHEGRHIKNDVLLDDPGCCCTWHVYEIPNKLVVNLESKLTSWSLVYQIDSPDLYNVRQYMALSPCPILLYTDIHFPPCQSKIVASQWYTDIIANVKMLTRT